MMIDYDRTDQRLSPLFPVGIHFFSLNPRLERMDLDRNESKFIDESTTIDDTYHNNSEESVEISDHVMLR
jgi:hypothetical protein